MTMGLWILEKKKGGGGGILLKKNDEFAIRKHGQK